MKLLQLDSSPLATHSVTRELAAAVVAQYRRDVPQAAARCTPSLGHLHAGRESMTR